MRNDRKLAVLFVAIQAKDKRPRTAWIALASLVALLAMVYWLGGREFTQRLISIHAETHAEISGGTRLSILRDGLHMWWKRPIAGWGLGTFSAVYPGFRSYYTNFFINQAHNDYLQCLIETGAAGFLIMGWFLFRLHRGSTCQSQGQECFSRCSLRLFCIEARCVLSLVLQAVERSTVLQLLFSNHAMTAQPTMPRSAAAWRASTRSLSCCISRRMSPCPWSTILLLSGSILWRHPHLMATSSNA